MRISLRGNTLALFGASLLARSIRLLYLAILTRLLAPHDVAIYTYGFAFYMLFSGFAAYGQAVFLAERRGRGGGGWARFLQHSMTVRAGAVAVVAVVGLGYLLVREGLDRDGAAVMLLFLAVIPRSYVFWLRQVMVAREDARRIPLFEGVARGGEFALGVVWLTQGGGLLGLCLLHPLVWFAEALLIRHFVERVEGKLRFGRSRRLMCAVARWSTLPMLSQWLRMGYLQLGIIAVRELAAGAQLANYAIAVQLLAAGLILPASLAQAMRTSLTRAVRYGERGANQLAPAIQAGLLGGGLVAVLVSGIGPAPIAWVFGADYLETGRIFLLLVWLLGPMAAFWLVLDGLNQIGRRRSALAAIGLATALQILVLWLGRTAGDLAPIHAIAVALALATLVALVIGLELLVRAGAIAGRAPALIGLSVLGVSAAVFYGVPLQRPGAALCAVLPSLIWFGLGRRRCVPFPWTSSRGA